MESIGNDAAGQREPLRDAVRGSIVWVVVVGPLLGAGWYLDAGRPLGELTLGIYVAAVGLLVLCESWLTFDTGWRSALRGSRTDFLYVVIAAAMDKASFVACVTAVAAFGRALAGLVGISLWPSGASLGIQLGVALLIADAAAYLRHRLFHWSPALWRFHRIHHSMTELYWIRSAYTHPLEQLCILMAIMLPIAFLGAGDDVVAAVAFLFGLSGLLQHANVDSRSSVLNYVFATPEVHRVHHRADGPGCHSNFSAFFVWMDVLLGTYRRPGPARAPIRVGLEGVGAFPGDFLSHLVMPFRGDPAADGTGDWGRSQGELPAAKQP